MNNINLINFSQTKTMGYYNYHGIAKNLIANGHCTQAVFKRKHNNISPALVLYFDNNKPMPIRQYRFEEYITFLNYYEVAIIQE